MKDEVPAPFVSADIDVRDLDGFMLNVERLLASELWALSTPEEFKAAVGLWCRAWKQLPGGSLPNDDRVLAAFSGAGARWRKVREMALRGFVLCSDGRLYHKVLCEDVVRAFAKKTQYEADRDADRERLRNWREAKRQKRTVNETPVDTQVKPVSPAALKRSRNGNETSSTGQDRDETRQDSSKGEAKQESHIETSESADAREGFSKSERGLGRYAPSEPPPPDMAKPAEAPPPTEEEKAEVDALFERTVAALKGAVPKGIHDAAAYDAAVKSSKFSNLIREINGWASTRLDGAARMSAWEVLATAERVGARSGMTPAERKSFDGLVTAYRTTTKEAKAA